MKIWGIVCLLVLDLGVANAQPYPSQAESLPAFKSDSTGKDPFRAAESGLSPFDKPATEIVSPRPDSVTVKAVRKDSGAAKADSVTDLLRKRRPGISIYLGVDFIDFSAKEKFMAALNTRTTEDSLDALQKYEPVHLAFPLGIQAVLPIGTYLDLVAKTHSYWYQQSAILGNRITKAHAGDEWYAVQANLGGIGMRYCLPPGLLSVSGQLGMYTQGIWYWNLGQSEVYSPYGSARANFNPFGSGYEIQLGFQQAITKPWKLTGAIGFLHQEFESDRDWQNVIVRAPPPGKVNWGSSAIQANFNLWYHFGVVVAPALSTIVAPATNSAPIDSSRHF
jgi:hypothetical protein